MAVAVTGSGLARWGGPKSGKKTIISIFIPNKPALLGAGGPVRYFTTLFEYNFDLGLGSTK